MDAKRVRNMKSDNKPSKTNAASRWLLTNTIFSKEIKIEDDKSAWNITDFLNFCDQSN